MVQPSRSRAISPVLGVLLGFLAGFIVGVIALTLEELAHGATLRGSLSDTHHHLAALIIGLLAAILGFLITVLMRKSVAGELRIAEQRDFLKTLIETVPIPIFYKDVEGHYLGCNRAFEAFVGRERAELIGRSVYELGPKEIADKYRAKDLELFEHPGTQVYDWLVNSPRGLREVVFHKATFQDGLGQVAGLVGAMLDVTEKRRGQAVLDREAARRSQLFGERGALAELTVSRSGEILSLSPALVHLLGIPDPAARIGQSAGALFNQPRELQQILLLDEIHTEGEYRTLVLEGAEGPLRTSVFTVPDGARLHLVISLLSTDALLIPICASCRLIRDGDSQNGVWLPPHSYFAAHADEIKHPTRPFTFTHSICPSCIKVIYPGL